MQNISFQTVASSGYAVGSVFIPKPPDLTPKTSQVIDKNAEILAFDQAQEKAMKDLSSLAEKNEIFEAHLEMIQDDEIKDGIVDLINNHNKNVEEALFLTTEDIAKELEALDDPYLSERGADVRDICRRIMAHLKNLSLDVFSNISKDCIIFAHDLTPSDTSHMDFDFVRGFVTEMGGVTSHVSIIAKGHGIPAAVGASNILETVKNGDFAILDAYQNLIIINPDENTLKDYQEKIQKFLTEKKEIDSLKHLPAITKNGTKVAVYANVSGFEEAQKAKENGAEGIGLFRTELFYMEKKILPTEEEQFLSYKKTAEIFNNIEGSHVIIRTLDIGGDKSLEYFDIGVEENPFLGYRAIRISLDKEKKQIFKTQLRALLRASNFGPIYIMYPFVVSPSEYIEANKILEECKSELSKEGLPFNSDIKTGIMIETPASVLLAEEFAQIVDFFSIGTNDLTQYILAVDRGNNRISHMYDSHHPAVMGAIDQVIKATKKYNKLCGMCGEFASDEKAIPKLLKLGLDEFSVAPSLVGKTKHTIRQSLLT